MNYQRISLLCLLGLFLLPSTLLSGPTTEDYYLTGFNFYAHKDYSSSILYLKAALQLDPKNWKAYQILGYDYYLQQQEEDAVKAFDQCLKWGPDNPALRKMDDDLKAKLALEAEQKEIYPRVFRKYPIWEKFEVGFITSSLGDLQKAGPAFQSYFGPKYGGTSASTDGFGPLIGLEAGFMLDTYNAWGVLFEGGPLNGFTGTAKDNFGNTLTQTLQPNMVSIHGEYYRFFKLGRFRLTANAGAGVYATVLELNAVSNGLTLESGEMAGFGFGGFLGVGFEMALGENFSAGAFLRGRWATTGNIRGIVSDSTGADQLETLGTAPLESGLVDAYPDNTPGFKPVNVDYTGADLTLSISYHY